MRINNNINDNYNCIICNSVKFAKKYININECLNCGHIFADYNLTNNQIKKIYNFEYFNGKEYCNYSNEKNILQKNFNLRIQTLLKFIEKPINKSLLEIGCAFGFFVNLGEKYFKDVEGIDISTDAIEYAKKKYNNIFYLGDFINHNYKKKIFDVICLWDTIEHLKEPEKYIEKTSHLLPKGGKLALTTPDIGSLVAKFRKKNWRMIHPPTHLHYFSLNNMCMLLEKNNYKIIYKKKCGFYRSIGSMAYIVFVLRLKLPIFYRLIKFLKIDKLKIYLNLYDIMYIIAEKK